MWYVGRTWTYKNRYNTHDLSRSWDFELDFSNMKFAYSIPAQFYYFSLILE